MIQHDVRRLDRLISDISDASRLDAELARSDAEPVDLVALLRAVVSMAEDSPRRKGVRVRLSVEDADRASGKGEPRYCVLGHDSRSFSVPGGEVRVVLRRQRVDRDGDDLEDEGERILITVEDDGPGMPPHALERIFERFYTDRPDQGFGQNSGLGLPISRQIVEAHRGRIWGENRPAPVGVPAPKTGALVGDARAEEISDKQEIEAVRHGAGARFVISLPAATL